MATHPVEDSHHSNNPSIWVLASHRLNRRDVLRGGLGSMLMGASGLLGLTACSTHPLDNGLGGRLVLGFEPVPHSLADKVLLPSGYRAQVLYALGDPIDLATPPYEYDGRDRGDWDRRAGDHHETAAQPCAMAAS